MFVDYDYLSPSNVIRLGLAALVGCSVIRWWVGSDVHNCLENTCVARFAQKINRLTRYNLAVAPHLVEELRTIGIKSNFIPSFVEAWHFSAGVKPGPPPRRVLVYLPSSRREFYGGSVIDRVIAANPDLEFLVVADTASDAHVGKANVRSLGWVKDLSSVYSQIGCVLRITKHDGLPRMVIEGLFRGKHVIYSWPLQGCSLAKTNYSVQEHLDQFKAARSPNLEGRDAIIRMYGDSPIAQFLDYVCMARSHFNFRPRFFSLAAVPPFFLINCFYIHFATTSRLCLKSGRWRIARTLFLQSHKPR